MTSFSGGIETSGESGGSSEVCWCGVCGGALGGARVRCVCGAPAPASSAPAPPRADPLDGLPPALDPLQARLHQIILYQKVRTYLFIAYANLVLSAEVECSFSLNANKCILLN